MFDFPYIPDATHNLQSMLEDLELLTENILRGGIVTIIEEQRETAYDILINKIEEAFTEAKEFDIPIFHDALLNTITENRDKDIIILNDKNISNGVIEITINLESYAGNLEDYAEGILYARLAYVEEAGGKGLTGPADKASDYWRDHIYKKAREGGGSAKGKELYDQIIRDRFTGFGSTGATAPFWMIMNDGTPESLLSDRGGTPYPTVPATRFVEIAGAEIEILLTNAYQRNRELIERKVLEAQNIAVQIESALGVVEQTPPEYRKPGVIETIVFNSRVYYLYITQTGLLGISQDPRVHGKRIR